MSKVLLPQKPCNPCFPKPLNLAMRTLFLCFLAISIFACSKPGPTPVIKDLEDGVVTTRMEEMVPLLNFRELGVTQVLLFANGVVHPDPALGAASIESRKRAAGVGTYSMGFEPEFVLAPDTPTGKFMGNPSASLSKATLIPYDPVLDASAIAALVNTDYAGKRIVIVAEQALLEDIGNKIAGSNVLDWPMEGENAIAFVTTGGDEATAQTFALQLDIAD